ncbi:YhcN/YlaJ family sporulation lipoprotein [Natribacillus halophilus]|uniref:Sporulation lipoprotein YhcN/YlaJ (Spore_YhcN_YlaJ) n=1 Tax=Natribacillus halophilus TaxID=549003 RepID=A0A1G8JG12_9BACI|nr:YhcN/YlaJ family sporulation lipoprotein [Natribacillus halophilus]SDI30011.1 Sporulation lipoprotein YhcN/YlaJ (Spore_YhcN_YlaJ) [Natribacillus halophilus]
MNYRSLHMLTFSVCAMVLLLSACGEPAGEEPEKTEPDMSHHSREPVNPPQAASEYWNVDPREEQTLAEEAKASTEELEQVKNAHAVSLDNHVYIVPEVRHMTRWNLEAFREEGREQLKETLPPDTIIHLSTDQKANMELKRLTEDIQSGTVSGEELDRRLESITEFMKTDV